MTIKKGHCYVQERSLEPARWSVYLKQEGFKPCNCSVTQLCLTCEPMHCSTQSCKALQASPSSTIFRSSLNLCPLKWWCHPTVSSSVIPFFSCPQSFPASRSFLMSQLFASGDQSYMGHVNISHSVNISLSSEQHCRLLPSFLHGEFSLICNESCFRSFPSNLYPWWLKFW